MSHSRPKLLERPSPLRKNGAPVENAPLEKVSGQPFQAAVLANAEHAAAAMLMAYFICCTAEGKKALYQSIGWAKLRNPQHRTL